MQYIPWRERGITTNPEKAAAPRVLIVDDEDSIRVLLARLLRRAGFDIVEAADGAQAIARLDDEKFDAVVLDLMMPRVNGFQVLEHAIENQPTIVSKIVVLTAYPKTAASERVHHLCSLLSKPFDTNELLEVVRDCTAR